MLSNIISECVVLENCVIISYYKDHHVWRHCQDIELISTAPFKNPILLKKYFKLVVAQLGLANLCPISKTYNVYRQLNYEANCYFVV